MTNKELLTHLQYLTTLDNRKGNDSTKRSGALEVIAGPADGDQTDRLLALAIAMVIARG